MFGIVLSALNAALGPLLSAIFIKAVLFTALSAVVMFVVAGLTAAGILPDVAAVIAGLGSLPTFVIYILQLFRFDLAVSLGFSAMATRFIIRRIPLVG
ncbi:MAG: hypothetical protein A3J24_11455 [Deltaproteobacteria bacterium RIFCSPLOWO2_02_FULL_53_8]|nr:MAG: hypothetical protein A3J24_11455 [Deltaproteobacteria bacterium RIFCSPLOWO2_02_FULL_53_8]